MEAERALDELIPDRSQSHADDELEPWRRLAQGDLEALDEIYDRHAADLHGLGLWLTGCRDAAADLVQDAFVRLVEARERLHRVRRPKAYLLRTLRRLAIDRHRQVRRRAEVSDDLLEPVGGDDPARRLEAQALSGLLRELPAPQREAIYLRHFVGLSNAEIGRVVGVPAFTVASRYRLAMNRLRKKMGVER